MSYQGSNLLNSLVETDWLETYLGDAGPDAEVSTRLRIVDARWRGDGTSRQLYRAGHLPGAVPLDWHLDLNETRQGVRDLLLPPERFAQVMEQAGIGDETTVVAYADTDHSGAARLWWALRYYGHRDAAVLNGGFTKWVAEGRPLTTQTPQVPVAKFTPRPQPGWLATKDEILVALSNPNPGLRLLDTRPQEQYRGQAVWTPQGSRYLPEGEDWVDANGRRLRGGRIPGAVNLPSTGNFDPADWSLLSPDALRARAESAGLAPDQRVIAYCGVGISASMGIFALHLAGYSNLALYDASWEEWGYDPELPIERPPG
jgi:thiosulfate/3-mercaptopyruvate sulfurtransferase